MMEVRCFFFFLRKSDEYPKSGKKYAKDKKKSMDLC